MTNTEDATRNIRYGAKFLDWYLSRQDERYVKDDYGTEVAFTTHSITLRQTIEQINNLYMSVCAKLESWKYDTGAATSGADSGIVQSARQLKDMLEKKYGDVLA